MALSEEPLSIVEQWNKKSFEMSSKSNDSIVSLLSRGIDTMAVVVNKTSDFDRIQRALSILEYERSLSIQFDKLKNDEVRSLVYGLIESLHFTLSELTKQRNQVKECGEVFTQTDQEIFQPSLLSEQVKESAEMFTQTDKELSVAFSSNDYADQSRDGQSMFPNLFEFPKEEPFDENSIKIEDLWEDEMEIKDEEMLNDDVENNKANEDMAENRGDISNIVDNDHRDQSDCEMPTLNYMGNASYFENEDFDETMNDSSANETMGEDREKDSSEFVEVEKNRRLSRNESRSMKFDECESLVNSDDDSEPVMKKCKAESSKMKDKKMSVVNEKKRGSGSTKGKSREMKCTECEYQTTSPAGYAYHLKAVHFTTLKLAGFALLCDCGVEARSHMHGYKCDIANYTVVRKRDGPIQRLNDEKTTPQCILCDVFPTSAYGYVKHVQRYHTSTLSAHGVFLQCSCGCKYFKYRPDFNHSQECTLREYTLHKIAGMALSEESLSIVEQWKKKSIEMSSDSNDTIVSLLSRGIDTMAVVINKKSDLDRVQRALAILECERSVSLQFDKIKNDEVRILVYGLIESLHFTLTELTKERNHVKDCGEMFTQTDQEPSPDVLSSNDYADQSRDEPSIIPNLFELPKEEPFDENSIKIEDLLEDSMEIKDEEMPNDDVEVNNANEDMAENRGDVSSIVDIDDMAQSEMPALDYMGDESHFENEDVGETMNSNDNENVERNRKEDGEKVSRPVSFADNESLDYSDEDFEPSMKKMKDDSSKRKIKTASGAIKKRGRPFSSNRQSREMKCTECEYQTTSAFSFVRHLRNVHSTTLKLAGLALRCDCGVESRSQKHNYECDIANFTVVRKRNGPIHRIKDEKEATPQCLLCDLCPTTAYGYIAHLRNYHNSTPIRHGIFLLCKCGAKYRQNHPDSNHTKECTRREFTLHKVADK